MMFCVDVANRLATLANAAQRHLETEDGGAPSTSTKRADADWRVATESRDAHKEDDAAAKEMYFKTVIFERDVLIVLDYVGAAQFDMQYGALAGIVSAITQLRGCRIMLKRVVFERGLLGFGAVAEHLVREWKKDALSTSSIVKSIEPVSLLTQFLRGIFDLFYLPVDQFRRNRSVLTGVKRGCRSFTQSTGIAALELLCRFVQCVEWLARLAHDIVSPQSRALRSRRKPASLTQIRTTDPRSANVNDRRTSTNNGDVMQTSVYMDPRMQEMTTLRAGGQPSQQPEDVRAAVVQASTDVLANVTKTFGKIYEEASEQPNLSNTVGAIVTNVPAAVTNQAMTAAGGIKKVVEGVANQIDPHRKDREDKKWKTN
jgi:hypothetical protein